MGAIAERVSAVIGLACIALAPSCVLADFNTAMKALEAKDYERARIELEKIVAEPHYGVARSILFQMYRDGNGIPRDPKRAYELYLPLAEKGSSNAMIELGNLAAAGAVDTDAVIVASSWFEKAIAKGNIGGYCGMAMLASPAPGRSGNATDRIRFLRLAAEDKTSTGAKCRNQALADLANAYATGDGVDVNPCLAIKYRGELYAAGGGPANWAGARERQATEVSVVELLRQVPRGLACDHGTILNRCNHFFRQSG